MIINKDTKISQILKHNPASIEAIASINPQFNKLRNPLLRKMLAPRVSVSAASKVGNCSIEAMLKVLENVGFEIEKETISNDEKADVRFDIENVTEEIDMKNENIEFLDVRPILESGVDPFKTIMDKLKSIDKQVVLCIINSFEPIPLLNILKEKGYAHKTEKNDEGIVYTYLFQNSEVNHDHPPKVLASVEDLSFEDLADKFKNNMTELDVRDLEMPLPMVSILEAIEQLTENHALFVHHKRLPQYLLPELEKRDFLLKSHEIDGDNIKLVIYRNPSK